MSLRIVFMGTPEFAVPALTRLGTSGHKVVAVVSQPDRPSGRHMRLTPTPVRKEAERLGLPVYQPAKLRDGTFQAWLEDLKPDLLITAAYGRILTGEILAIPKYGCLNIHASLLPAYRGASPINASIINGETKTGITIMKTDVGMDTGDILYQEEVAIPGDMDAGTLSGILSDVGARCIVPVAEAWTSGAIVPVRQDEEKATYAPMMSRADGKIDWTVDAQTIHNLIRGTSPWPGAFTTLDGKRVKIHRSAVSCDAASAGITEGMKPGYVIGTCPQCIRVACGGETCLELQCIQAEACRRMDAEECFHNFRPGMVFGEE